MDGQLPLIACRRLTPLLVETDGEALFYLTFEKLLDRFVVRGRVRASLQVVCQRCLESMPIEVDQDVAIEFVGSIEQVNQVPDNLEPCLVEDDEIDVRILVEDELILAIPTIPRHNSQACTALVENLRSEDLDECRVRPFAALAALRGNQKMAD